MHSVDCQQYPMYTLNIVNIHLRSSTTLPMPKPPLITEIPDTPTTLKILVSKEAGLTNVTILAQAQPMVEPPFLEKLVQSKPIQIEE